MPQPALAIAGNDCLPVRLATVNDDASRTPMTLKGLTDEALCRNQITVFPEEETGLNT